MEIVFFKDRPNLFLAALSNPAQFPYFDATSFALNSVYYQHYFGPDCTDFSFYMTVQNEIVAVVPCQMHTNQLKHNGGPITIHINQNLKTQHKVAALIESSFLQILKDHNITNALIRTPQPDLYDFASRFIKISNKPDVLFHTTLDLTKDEKTLHAEIRRSYTSLINWGKKNMRFAYLTQQNPDAAQFENVRQFHAQVAGRVTRSAETWQTQLDMIKAGRAEMSIGFLEDKMVSAGFYIDEGQRTIYGTGIYNRDLFDKPLAHALLYDAILRAKNRGQKQFYVGDVYARHAVEAKQYQIGDFKKGFSDRMGIDLVWTIEKDK